MIVYAEGSDHPVWKPGDELPCGCRLSSSQLVALFGAHVDGQRGYRCIHDQLYVVTAGVERVVKFEIEKSERGIQ